MKYEEFDTRSHRSPWRAARCALMIGGVLLVMQPVVGEPLASDAVTLDIRSQPLADALSAFAQQSGLQILFRTGTGQGNSPAVVGKIAPVEALARLLANTSLEFEFVDERTVAIREKRKAQATSWAQGPSKPFLHVSEGDTAAIGGGAARLAQAEENPATDGGKPEGVLEEVVVTAQKREQRLQDVPVPVAVVDAAALTENNQQQLRDYFAKIPGVSYNTGVGGAAYIAVRGLTVGAGVQNPTTAVVLDDVPVGSSIGWGGGGATPDLDPAALSRIELLRGPQGTLYGASSLGGLLKYVTADPSFSGVNGRVQLGMSSVENGHEAGYNVSGAVNVPLRDTLAFRATGFTRRDPGYIDNTFIGKTGINRLESSGGMLTGLWQPSESFSIKLNALLQTTRTFGTNAVSRAALGELTINDLYDDGDVELEDQLYTATLKARLGIAELTAVSGYSTHRSTDVGTTADDSAGFFGFLGDLAFGVSGVKARNNVKTEKFSQEVRLQMPLGDKLDWLIGGFYTAEHSPWLQQFLAVDLATLEVAGSTVNFDWLQTYADYAGFTNLTVNFTDRFNIQLGGRLSHIKQEIKETDTGIFAELFEGGDPAVFPRSGVSATAFTYLITPQFKFSQDLMAYARVASGYRAASNNVNCTSPFYNVACYSKPDKTQNYELGMKGRFPGLPITFDASLYYIDWKNLQLSVADVNTGVGIFINGGRARSKGVELSIAAHPIGGLALSGWVAFNDADLVDSLPDNSPVFGVSGDRLPFSSEFSASLSADYEFALTDVWTMFAGGIWSYLGERSGDFPSGSPIFGPAQPRLFFASYGRTDVHLGVRRGPWTGNLFVNNVADKRGVINGGYSPVRGASFNYIQPRLIGLSVSRTF